jgi:DNA-binding MarR family transcriptional regulator
MSKDMQVGSLNSPGEVSVAIVSLVAAEAGGTESGASPTGAVDQLPELDAVESRAWRSFLIAHARVARRLEADLLARSHLPLAEFDVLMQLSLAEGQRLRMNELADRVVLSRAGITRLVDRLVADGSVARIKCASDARGAYAILTDPGRARLDEARPSHFKAVRRYFLESFAKPELEALADLLDRDFPVD